jgi:hypothetical protein
MTKDRLGRRVYRKSPGRQYGYDYNPLRGQSRGGQSQSGRSRASAPGERQAAYEDAQGSEASRPGGYGGMELAPRPDPRRTRQLMRQSILASKARTALYGEQEDEAQDQQAEQHEYEEQEESTPYGSRGSRGNHSARPRTPSQALYRTGNLDRETGEAELEVPGFVDPDSGVDPLAHRLNYPELSTRRPAERGVMVRRNGLPEEYDDYDYEEDRPRIRRKVKEKNLSRRRLLVGLGTIAVGGAAVAAAAYELPKLPQAINDAGTNIEHQIQDAFNKGFSSGEDAVRREFITALDQLEGISLDAAVSAAKLTRVAYDVFVSPLVTFLANIADNFLTVTLQALITGRHWLANIGQDNGTLGALQKVLESWVQDAQQMPKQLQAIADADLDGAQSYLRALKRKINAEQAKLNGNSTPTIKPAPDPTATPHH